MKKQAIKEIAKEMFLNDGWFYDLTTHDYLGGSFQDTVKCTKCSDDEKSLIKEWTIRFEHWIDGSRQTVIIDKDYRDGRHESIEIPDYLMEMIYQQMKELESKEEEWEKSRYDKRKK